MTKGEKRELEYWKNRCEDSERIYTNLINYIREHYPVVITRYNEHRLYKNIFGEEKK